MSYKKHINKLNSIMNSKELLSIYDIEEGIFKRELASGEITQTQLIEHVHKTTLNRELRFVKKNKFEKAYDFVLSCHSYKTDKTYNEMYVASVYIDIQNKGSLDKYYENPLYEKVYYIKHIDLYCVKYNKNFPKEFYVTKYKT